MLRNEYTHAEEERLIDQVVVEYGTLPEDALYFAMKEASVNRGETDLRALIEGRPQPSVNGSGEGVCAVPHRRRRGGPQYPRRDL